MLGRPDSLAVLAIVGWCLSKTSGAFLMFLPEAFITYIKINCTKSPELGPLGWLSWVSL